MINAQRVLADLQLGTTSSTATASANWDLTGCDYAVLKLHVGPRLVTNPANLTVSLLDCDNTTVSNYVTVVANQTITPVASPGCNLIYFIDTRAKKRYLRMTTTPGTTPSNDALILNATLFKSRLATDPVSAAAAVASTNDTAVMT